MTDCLTVNINDDMLTTLTVTMSLLLTAYVSVTSVSSSDKCVVVSSSDKCVVLSSDKCVV